MRVVKATTKMISRTKMKKAVNRLVANTWVKNEVIFLPFWLSIGRAPFAGNHPFLRENTDIVWLSRALLSPSRSAGMGT
jgi:hypothetical protein